MQSMWSLGGLSPREALKRTIRESWQDEVFGLSARLAFYFFMAFFPGLLLLLALFARLAGTGAGMRETMAGALAHFLPGRAAGLVAGAISDLNASAHGRGMLLAMGIASALWAGFNASWAMIVGLNAAYEVREDRSWWEIALAAAGLGLALLIVVFATLLIARFAAPLARAGVLEAILRWAVTIAILMISYALFFRFGPNLKPRRWQWSTPGAVLGGVLWVALTLAAREYFDRFASYQEVYGRTASAAMLLMWMYVTSATVLMGAELNSEIEKAAGHRADVTS